MPESFSLSMVRTEDDYGAYYRQAIAETPDRRFGAPVTWVFGAIALCAAIGLGLWQTSPDYTLRLPLLLMLFCSFFGIWAFLYWLVLPQARFSAPSIFLGEQTMHMDEHGVRIEGAGYSCTYAWSAFSDLVSSPSHIFLRIGGRTSVVVPQRAFASNAQASEFITMVRGHLRVAA